MAISIDILEATLTPEKKMRIMYKANLNYERFTRYFNDLLRKGFIDKTNDAEGKTCYKITERGRTLLATLKKGQELFNSKYN